MVSTMNELVGRCIHVADQPFYFFLLFQSLEGSIFCSTWYFYFFL